MNDCQFHWVILLIGCVMGCVTPSLAAAMPLRELAKGHLSGIAESKNQVIKEQSEWEKYWAHHTGSASPAPKIPKVDFAKEMVIAATMGRQHTGGFSIEITRVEEKDGKLQITIKRTSPKPGGITIQALTAPFCFVVVGKSGLKPEFIEDKQPDAK